MEETINDEIESDRSSTQLTSKFGLKVTSTVDELAMKINQPLSVKLIAFDKLLNDSLVIHENPLTGVQHNH